MARAEFVLARQERQRTAMTELLSHLKEDGKGFDASVEAHCAAAARAALVLTAEAKHLDEIADQGLRHRCGDGQRGGKNDAIGRRIRSRS